MLTTRFTPAVTSISDAAICWNAVTRLTTSKLAKSMFVPRYRCLFFFFILWVSRTPTPKVWVTLVCAHGGGCNAGTELDTVSDRLYELVL